MNENIFFAIDIWKIELTDLFSDKSLMNFMELIQLFIVEKLRLFRKLVQEMKIEITVIQKDVSSDDLLFATELMQLNPYGIEWSNIPDYMETKKFIDFAKLCSGKDTIHTLDVMNWKERIFGSCWVDYMDDKSWVKETYYKIKKEAENRNAKYFFKRSTDPSCQITKFIQPVFLNFPADFFDAELAIKYAPKYVEHFCKDKDGSQINSYLDASRISYFDPFSINATSFHINLTFNKSISLKTLLI